MYPTSLRVDSYVPQARVTQYNERHHPGRCNECIGTGQILSIGQRVRFTEPRRRQCCAWLAAPLSFWSS